MIRRRCPSSLLRKLPSLLVDRNNRVAALVCVNPDRHHEAVSPSTGGARPGSVGGHIPVGDSTLLSSHAGRSHHGRAGRTTETSHEGNQEPRASPHGGLTLTLGSTLKYCFVRR